MTPNEVQRFFQQRDKQVVTFVGFSGAGYQDQDRMLALARDVLSVHSPKKTIINIGVTVDGIGAVYELAKQMGFETTGIVSTQARKYDAQISGHVDHAFFVPDESWGGFQEGSDALAPTSQALVLCSDVVVGIGGGAVAHDELVAARRAGIVVKYFPAEMNHQKAIDKAKRKGLPAPIDFKGAAHAFEGGAH